MHELRATFIRPKIDSPWEFKRTRSKIDKNAMRGVSDRTIRDWKNGFQLDMMEKLWRPVMRKQASSTAENLVSIRVPKKLSGKKLVLVDAAEYAALKRRLAEIGDALEKISRGDAACRQGRTKTVSSLSELAR